MTSSPGMPACRPGRRRTALAAVAVLVALAASTLLVATGRTPAQAIVDGRQALTRNGQVQVFVNDGQYECTGSLLSTQWVLTAKHCLEAPVPTPAPATTKVRIGSFDLGVDGAQQALRFVKNDTYDVALIQIARTIRIDETVPYGSVTPPVGDLVSLSGWGETTHGSRVPSPVLRTADMQVNNEVPGAGLRQLQETQPVQFGHGALGDSGAGVISYGAVCGVQKNVNTAAQTNDFTQMEVLSGWIQATTSIAPSATACRPAERRKKRYREMALGDSITEGFKSSDGNGYRATLHGKLEETGAQVDFVGGLHDGNMKDPDHEGHSGFVISEIDRLARARILTYKPNVVTLHIGTNDMASSLQVSTAPQRLEHLLDTIYGAGPDMTVVLSTLVPSRNPTTQANIQQYNASLPGLVSGQRDKGRHVELVDMGRVTTADLADDLHPNDNGYSKMGQIFAEGVEEATASGWVVNRPNIGPRDPGPVAPDPGPGRWSDQGIIATGVGADPDSTYTRFADLDGDGRADYLVVDKNGAVDAWRNEGNLGDHWGWFKVGRVATGIGAPGSEIRFADLNGDSRADYLAVKPNGAVDMYLNGGYQDGKWIWIDYKRIATGIGAPGDRIQFADINGDNRADYLAVDPQTGATDMYLNGGGQPGDWLWIDYKRIATGVRSTPDSTTTFGDLNEDGYDDYLYISKVDGTVQAYTNKGGKAGDWGWVPQGQVLPGDGAASLDHRVSIADIDGDGRVDYLALNRFGALHAWLDQGRDTSSVAGWLPRGKIATGIGVDGSHTQFGDLNGDGLADYLGRHGDDSVHAYLNGGSKTGGGWDWIDAGNVFPAPPKVPYATDVQWADVNHDNRVDYLRDSPNGGSVDVWLNDGGRANDWHWTHLGLMTNGAFGGWGGVERGGGNLTFRDIDGDGYDDYEIVRPDGVLDFARNNWPDGGKQYEGMTWRVATGVGTQGTDIRLADFDGDGRDDYLTLGNNGSVKVWINRPDPSSPRYSVIWVEKGQVAGGVGASNHQVRFPDLDGDGRGDYTVVGDNGSVTTYLNNGGDH